MRVLLVSEVTGRMLGGVPAETAQFIRGFTARGHEVALLADMPLPSAPQAHHFTLRGDRRVAPQIGEAVEAWAPDVVHAMGLFPRRVLESREVLARRPWVYTCHAVSPYERSLPALHAHERLHYAARAVRYAAKTLGARVLLRSPFVPKVIVHSAFMADIVERYGCPRERIAVIPLGFEPAVAAAVVPMRAPPVRDAQPRLLTVAGIAHTKGQHDVLHALPALLARHPRLLYTIVGEVRDGTYLQYLRDEVARLALGPHVRFALHVTDEGKQALLRDAQLYLQPSHEEGFCLSFIEAAAMVPRLVGTRTGAMPLVAEGDAGMRIVPPRSPQELAEAALRTLDAPLPADWLPRREARLTATLAWSRYWDAHEALYAGMLEGTAAAPRPSPADPMERDPVLGSFASRR